MPAGHHNGASHPIRGQEEASRESLSLVPRSKRSVQPTSSLRPPAPRHTRFRTPGSGTPADEKNNTHPSEKSACSRCRYVSHLFPITFPQVKHRTGMIIFFRRPEGVPDRTDVPRPAVSYICIRVCCPDGVRGACGCRTPTFDWCPPDGSIAATPCPVRSGDGVWACRARMEEGGKRGWGFGGSTREAVDKPRGGSCV